MEKPEYIVWVFTAKCNLNCLHCYTHRLRNRGELSLEEKIRIAESIGESGVKYVNLTGGEPLTHPHLPSILQTLSEYSIDKSIVTNGVVVSGNTLDLLYKTNTYVFVTVEGPREVHDAIRGRGTYDSVVRNIKALKKTLGSISLVTTINKVNYIQVDEVVVYAASIDVDELAVIPVMPFGRAVETGVYITAEEYLEALSRIRNRAREYGLNITAWCTPWIPLYWKDMGHSFCRDMNGMDIDPLGNVLLCDVLDLEITNVRNRSIVEAFKEYREHVLVRNVMNPSKLAKACSDCPIQWGCRGGCFARAYTVRGDLNAGDALCPRIHESAKSHNYYSLKHSK